MGYARAGGGLSDAAPLLAVPVAEFDAVIGRMAFRFRVAQHFDDDKPAITHGHTQIGFFAISERQALRECDGDLGHAVA